jgi:hypothetical protein
MERWTRQSPAAPSVPHARGRRSVWMWNQGKKPVLSEGLERFRAVDRVPVKA